MVHHLSIAVSDLARSGAFYDAALGPLGYVRVWTHEVGSGHRQAAIGYGWPGGEDEFAIRWRPAGSFATGDGFHVAFRARSREAVVAFHRAALESGGQDNGGAGLHPEYGPSYFAAFVLDPDGYRIEAVRSEEESLIQMQATQIPGR
ncbi:MAG: VOC family protein [Verrucomicrobiales bacterium]|nr:VOC family protein [Verrucomicrobiales bacterium]